MKTIRRHVAAFLCILLLLALSAAACADDAPFTVTVQLGTGSYFIRAYADSFDNNLYLSLSDLSAALSSTAKQFRVDYLSDAQDGDRFYLTSGQSAAAPSLAREGASPSVSALYPVRNRLYLDGRELKYYTHRAGNELFMSLTDIQLMLDVTMERGADGSLRLYPERPFAPEPGALAADGFFDSCSAILLGDLSTGEVLYSRNGRDVFPIASLSKLMAYLVIAEAINAEDVSLTAPVPISDKAEALSLSVNGMIPLHAGTSVPLTELLDAMLIASSNESALALAEYFGGDEAAFVETMNRRARELGLNDAVFLSPHGLPVYSDSAVPAKLQNSMSAASLFSLIRCLLDTYPALTERTLRQYVTLPTLDYITANSNPMVFNLPGTTGLKTGNTTRAGYCLATTLPVSVGMETHTVACIVLGAETAAMRNQITQILLLYAQRYYAQNGFSAG